MPQGRFITFEGGEGSGKSTQLALLADRLAGHGTRVIRTREPGGAPGAEQIRRLLVEGEVGRWDALTEALLLFAARRDHLVRTIWPALAAGDWVLSDRFADSTLAYQGYGHGLPVDQIEQLYRLTVGEFTPDLTLILDQPVGIGLDRAKRRGSAEDRFERMDEAFHQRLRQGYLAVAARYATRCVVLPANGTIEQVQSAVWDIVKARLLPALP